MNRCAIVISLFSVLLLAGLAAGQSSTIPATPAASHLVSSKKQKQNAPCPPPTTDGPTLFDVHEYSHVGAGVHAPKALYAPDPEYSEAARKAHLNGSVAVAVALAVNEKGGIDDVKVVCSTDQRFEQNALDAIRQWQFAPGTKDGKPVAVQIFVDITFESQ